MLAKFGAGLVLGALVLNSVGAFVMVTSIAEAVLTGLVIEVLSDLGLWASVDDPVLTGVVIMVSGVFVSPTLVAGSVVNCVESGTQVRESVGVYVTCTPVTELVTPKVVTGLLDVSVSCAVVPGLISDVVVCSAVG